jgi:hypothetical protein
LHRPRFPRFVAISPAGGENQPRNGRCGPASDPFLIDITTGW